MTTAGNHLPSGRSRWHQLLLRRRSGNDSVIGNRSAADVRNHSTNSAPIYQKTPRRLSCPSVVSLPCDDEACAPIGTVGGDRWSAWPHLYRLVAICADRYRRSAAPGAFNSAGAGGGCAACARLSLAPASGPAPPPTDPRRVPPLVSPPARARTTSVLSRRRRGLEPRPALPC